MINYWRRDLYEKHLRKYWVQTKTAGRMLMLGFNISLKQYACIYTKEVGSTQVELDTYIAKEKEASCSRRGRKHE